MREIMNKWKSKTTEKIIEASMEWCAKYGVEPEYVILGTIPYNKLKFEGIQYQHLEGYKTPKPDECTMMTFTGMEVLRTNEPEVIAFGVSLK